MIDTEKAEQYIHEENGLEFENPINEIPKNDNSPEQSKGGNIWNILKAKTGEGTIQDYEEHPLNFNNNKYIGQILRGLTGILGALDLAIIDISMGIFGLMRERNIVKEVVEDNV
jgi:hypothetical protein